MDLLEDPEIKKTYDKCKYIVKVWEHKFIKKNKRVPSKLDIKEAPSEVKQAYKKYFHLKSTALEQSFMDVEGFEDVNLNEIQEDSLEIEQLSASLVENFTENDSVVDKKEIGENSNPHILRDMISNNNASVWGNHLNKNTDFDLEGNEQNKKQKGPSKPIETISKKLFCGSKFKKRNPHKSLSFTQKKTESSFESSELSQPDPSSILFMSQEVLTDAASNTKPFASQDLSNTESAKTFSPCVPVNIVDRILETRQRESLMKKVDLNWLKRVSDNVGHLSENSEPFSVPRISMCDKVQNESIETKLDYDSEDIIEDSDDEQDISKNRSIFHIAKKFKTSKPKMDSNDIQQNSEQNVTDEFSNLASSNIVNCSVVMNPTDNVSSTEILQNDQLTDSFNTQKESQKYITDKAKAIDNHIVEPENQLPDANLEPVLFEKSKETTKNQHKKKISNKFKSVSTKINVASSPVNLRRSSRKNMVKTSFEELSSGEEDPFYSDNDDADPEFLLHTDLKKKSYFNDDDLDKALLKPSESNRGKGETKKTHKATGENKNKKVTNSINKTEQNENSGNGSDKNYELEFSIKRRVVKPRYGSIKKIIREKLDDLVETEKTNKSKDIDKSLPKDKQQQSKEKLEQKIASGNLNDNFVTLNLRKKVFVRGKKGKNFSKFKKAMWKNKKKALYGPDMDMSGCDGGRLICFNCGQEGHFARYCKSEKGDGLLPLTNEEEEECPYPTLEEATKMASESSLTVRRPNFIPNSGNNSKKNVKEEIENDVPSEDEEWLQDIDSEILLAEVTKLEEHVKKLDIEAYMDNVKIVEPYYKLKQNGNILETPNEVFEVLKKFGHSGFRQGQEKAIMRILSGKSTLVTLSTGSGKSLCYQLPAYLYSQRESCISLIISPLVSLMEDQVIGIPKFLKAACLHTNQTSIQRQKIIDAISKRDLDILLISPEAVVAGEKQTGFGSLLRKLPPIAFACIDEAHCVSQWSHNFRPSYLLICRVLKESLGVRTILGLTATATRATSESIIQSLEIPDGIEGIISDTPLPANLCLTASKDANRDRALINLLLSDRFKNCKSIIVYCTRRDECERIASFLRTSFKNEVNTESTNKKRKRLNLLAEPYHAGLSASRRRTIQNAFMSGDLRVVVATVAFGMGINKADIRAVIHYNMPNSFESYVQEVGRAGRDGLPAHCHVFLDSQGRDENELRRHIHANSIDRHVIRKLLQKIFIPCSCKDLCPKHEVAFSIDQTIRALDIPEENIATLLCYLELHTNKYIELLNPAYTMCKVISYGGPLEIRKAAKDCPPLAMALALYKSKESDNNVLEFPIVDIASAMGWDSGICKHKLKNLEWTTVNNQPKRSKLSIQFTELGFRILAPGNLIDEQLDQTLDSLHNQVVDQETKALKQLHAVHKTLLEVAEKNYISCTNIKEQQNEVDLLKQRIREYFNSPDPLANIGKHSPKKINEEQLVNDIKSIICMYRDNQFTGRAIARIFHGIKSPNYPAVIWGRCKFWRSHLHEDFNEICRIATREIIRLR